MNLYNLFPALNGYKSLIGCYGLILVGLGGLLVAVGNCLQVLELDQCYTDISGAWVSVLSAFGGLAALGIAHKVQKSKE